MLEELKQKVYEANVLLPKYNLIIFTWGNVSGIDREKGLVVIKPSGVEYDHLSVHDMVVVDFDGNTIEGHLKPSSDTATHLELYKSFPNIGGITHTHSTWATIWAQAGRAIPAYGTTHADYFDGAVPCTKKMVSEAIEGAYERETGLIIIETLKDMNPDRMKAALVNSHGPFTWGRDPKESVEISVALENIAKMAHYTEMIGSVGINTHTHMQEELLRKHFDRKHGANAYYGQ